MSERVEHRGTFRNPDKQGWYALCSCDWQSVDMRQGSRGRVFATREEAVSAYQEHVYAAMGREAAELLANGLHGQLVAVSAFLARQRAALEVEGA